MVKKSRILSRTLIRNLLLLVFALVITLVYVQYIGYKQELAREGIGFISLRNDMKSLQPEFNKVDDGWTYGEGCRGKGGDFDSDIPSSCAVSLTNRSADVSQNQQVKMEAYSSLITKSGHFTITDGVQKIGQDLYFASYSYTNLDQVVCGLNTFRDNDNPSHVNTTFGCTRSSSQFYFPRNDL